MKPKKVFAGFCALSLLTALGACAPGAPTQLAQTPATGQALQATAPASAQPVKTHHVNFRIEFPKNFQLTEQNVSASYARLRVQGLVNGQIVTKLPSNPDADENGYVPINNGLINVGADIPEGNNWVLIAELQINANPNSNPLSRVMGAFHVTSSGSPTVEINARTDLPAMIVSALQELKSSLLNTAIDLAALKSFCDALTGASGTGNNISFSRLNTAPVSAPTQLSGRMLALLLANGTAMTQNAGQSLNPIEYRQTPYVVGTYNLNPGTVEAPSQRHSGLPVYSADTGKYFLMDMISNKQNNDFVSNTFYGVGPDLSQALKTTKTDISYGFASAGHSIGNTPVLYAATGPLGSTQLLRAYKQSDGSQVWSFTLNGTTTPNQFFPASQIDTKGTPSTSDDEDVVYGYFPSSGSNPSDRGIYAVEGGVGRWFYKTPTLSIAPAIAHDGNSLYVVTSHATASQLISLPTRVAGSFIDKVNGGCTCNLMNSQNTPNWTINLGRGVPAGMVPAIGTDGTIYIGTYTGNTGYLEAYTPAGTKKWEIALPPPAVLVTSPLPLSPRPTFSPIVDNQNGHDVIYLFTNDARVFALNDDGTAKWKDSGGHIQAVQMASTAEAPDSNPFGSFTCGSAVLGLEPLSQARILYTGVINPLGTNPEITAIRDEGSSGKILWGKYLGGFFATGGMQLKDGYLYYQTLTGGEGTFSGFQRVRVEANNSPPGAPWPMLGGNPSLSGRRPSDVNL